MSWLLAESVSAEIITPATRSTASRRALFFASRRALSLLPATIAASPVASWVTNAGWAASAVAENSEATSSETAVSFRAFMSWNSRAADYWVTMTTRPSARKLLLADARRPASSAESTRRALEARGLHHQGVLTDERALLRGLEAARPRGHRGALPRLGAQRLGAVERLAARVQEPRREHGLHAQAARVHHEAGVLALTLGVHRERTVRRRCEGAGERRE